LGLVGSGRRAIAAPIAGSMGLRLAEGVPLRQILLSNEHSMRGQQEHKMFRSLCLTMGTLLFLLGPFLLVGKIGERRIVSLGDNEAQSIPERIACDEIMRREQWDANRKVLIIGTDSLKDGGWMVTVHSGWHRRLSRRHIVGPDRDGNGGDITGQEGCLVQCGS
jgi:hypothetical protein